MKKLKFIELEINELHISDETKSFIPVVETTVDGESVLKPVYENTYDFDHNRSQIEQLHCEEREIRGLLARFNIETKVDGYDFTMAEGLVRLAELKSEIRVLSSMTRGGAYSYDRYNSNNALRKAVFDYDKAKLLLKELQRELSKLQVAIDRTNLNSEIEY